MIINAEEVFEMAVQVERNGRDFYTKAALISKTPEAKALLEKLAKVEEKHEKTFIELKELFVEKTENTMQDTDSQALAYIRAMVDGKVFCVEVLSEKLRPDSSLMDIYKIALDFEKSSIVFFSAIKKMVLENSQKEKVEMLINEELGHIAIITREIAAIETK